MKFDCHREKCRRKDRPGSEHGIIVIEPPVFAHSGSNITGKRQMIFEYSELDKLNEMVFKWVKTGRLTQRDFLKYQQMISQPLVDSEMSSSKKH
jgi:hypothetical protein